MWVAHDQALSIEIIIRNEKFTGTLIFGLLLIYVEEIFDNNAIFLIYQLNLNRISKRSSVEPVAEKSYKKTIFNT